MATFTEYEIIAWANNLGVYIYEDTLKGGYWIFDKMTHDGVWPEADDNFCASHEELECKLYKLEDELVAKEIANEG